MIHNRTRDYLLFGLLLAVLATVMSKIHWVSSASLHTLMEVLATTLALVVGVMALIRYYSHAENKYFLVGIGFIGAGLLDAFHSTVTSFWFHQAFPLKHGKSGAMELDRVEDVSLHHAYVQCDSLAAPPST